MKALVSGRAKPYSTPPHCTKLYICHKNTANVSYHYSSPFRQLRWHKTCPIFTILYVRLACDLAMREHNRYTHRLPHIPIKFALVEQYVTNSLLHDSKLSGLTFDINWIGQCEPPKEKRLPSQFVMIPETKT